MSDSENHILRTYLRRLTNLSGSNRSLLLLRLRSEQLLDLQQLSFLNGEKAFEIIKALIAGKSKKICPLLDSRMEATNEASRKLKRLQRLDKFIFEERGSYDLHVGWPFVRGKFSDGTLVRCPLLYFPISIIQENTQWVVTLREDAGISFNKSFLLAYSFYNKLKLSDDLADTTFEDFDRDSTVFRTQLYQLLKETVELNFNPDTFTDDLLPFEEFRKTEFEERHHLGEIKLFPEAVLGIFPQAGSQLVPDYLHLIENQPFINFEEFFSSRVVENSNPISNWVSHIKEEKIYTPFMLDAYQEHALRIIKDGKSLVVQGPPGTGKSQLISNLMADAIASGKKILLVCQKRVALDVVYDRLKKIGLADFLCLIHDFRNDRKAIYEKIARQIDGIGDFKARNRSVDSIQLERRFFQVCRTIDQHVETLEEFRSALFDEKECGISVKELYLTSNPKSESINIQQEYQNFNFNIIGDYVSKIRRYVQYAAILEIESHVWKNRKSFATFKLGHLKEIEGTIKSIPVFQQQLKNELSNFISRVWSLEECELLLKRKREVFEMLALINDDESFRYLQSMDEQKVQEPNLHWLQNEEQLCLNCFEGVSVEALLPLNQIELCLVVLQERIAVQGNIFKRIRWELFSKQKSYLKHVLITNELKFNKIGLSSLTQRLKNRLKLEHQLASLHSKKWLLAVPQGVSLNRLRKWFNLQTAAMRAKFIFNSLPELQSAINIQKLSYEQFQKIPISVFLSIQKVPSHLQELQRYLSPYQISHLLANPEAEDKFIQSLQVDFDRLCEFDKIKETMLAYESSVLLKLTVHVGSWEVDKITELFKNSIRLAWIDHIEMKYPILRSVSTFKMNEMQTELQQMVQEKQRLSTEIVLLRARERVYENIEYNRLNNRVTYRDLHHQVTKKKKIWPVRKIISEFSEEIFNLMPCWMASPEAVSAVFPMQQLFDLVIFDEASQCFSERGIPAMCRGNQVLIAGDSKQLKPFELYQVRWDAEEELAPDVDVDSLLELSERYLPTVHLQGHYRSRSQELIDFSNKLFYNNRLQLLPSFETVSTKNTAIEFKNVHGMWEDQLNRVEATMVVEEVVGLTKQQSSKEIGVITFNAPQQQLIIDMLEDRFAIDQIAWPDTLFVKNIENVQGDEKDIIIFCIGYAPDKNGKINLHFGSLSVSGGENRLNVAVTRAREKVIIITSVQPEQLKVDDIKNEGPKLLRQYLEYARLVSQGLYKVSVTENVDHGSDWYLAKRLYSETVKNSWLPFSDLIVTGQNEIKSLILTDDENFSNTTSKTAHATIPLLLKMKGWEYTLLFSRNYWINGKCVSDLLLP